MYQTLQQRLKKFQGFIEKWSNSSANPSTVGFMEEPPLLNPQAVELRKQGESVPSFLALMEQFKALKEVWLELQQSLEHSSLPPYGQALHTEMHKQFRLMEVDITFLKAARQPKTIAQRKQQLSNRLHQLIDYCETGIKLSQ